MFFTACLLAFAQFAFSQIEFVENKGQWNRTVNFRTNAGTGSFFLQNTGFTVAQNNPDDIIALKNHTHGQAQTEVAVKKFQGRKVRGHAYTVKFLNATNPEIFPEQPLKTYNNYFIGNDKTKWASNCKIYQAILYKNVYPGIDVRYYTDAGNNLKYDFIVHPGGDPGAIAMKYDGVNKLEVRDKELIITTSLGENKELYPYTYQAGENKRNELDCKYVVKDNVVRFKIKDYNKNETLTIDPTEIFFSYSGSTSDNWGFTATYGADGSFYGGGIAWDPGFPASPGAYDTSFDGVFDISIMKLSPDGSNRLYATYLGGSAEDQPHSLIEDAQGNLVIAGRTSSTNYPTTVATFGTGGGFDIIVTKLNAAGNGLIGSVKIGGKGDDGVNIEGETGMSTNSLKRNYGDDSRSEVLLDGAGNIYVASSTSSADYPVTKVTGAFQTQLGGKQDGVVIKLNPTCNAVLFNTYLGGSENDAAYVLKIGDNGNVYIAGGTASTDMKGISASGVVQPGFSGGECDGFVIELNNTGTSVIRGTYVGTSSADQIYGIEKDKFGFIYVMGISEGSFPVINATYSNPGSKQFIAKLPPDLSNYVYSTVFGSGSAAPNISPTAFLVDRCENVYVSGWGGKANKSFTGGNVRGMPVTPNAIKGTPDQSGSDFYFFVLKKDAASQLYGTFFGEENGAETTTYGEHVDGGTSRFDRNGIIYQALCANCFKGVAFPGTPGSWSPTNQATTAGKCNLGMLKIEMDFTGVQAGLRASINGVPYDTTGCVPILVNFSDTLQKAKRYYWYFGDGQGDTTLVPASDHVYNSVGTFRVMLVAIDSATCNISDTAYTHIRVGNNKANLDFVASKIPPCTNLSYSFTNISTATKGTFPANVFVWDFGDNTPPVIASLTPAVNHTFAGPGTYVVKLSVSDTNFCNSPVDTSKNIRISPQVTAAFETPPGGCVPYDAVFNNTSLGGLDFQWDFGDGFTSNQESPTHFYTTVGTYRVVLKAFDSSSCNKVDSIAFSLTVSAIPNATFSFNPVPPQENTFTNFVNQSTGANSYLWDFADGDTSTVANPSHIFPATGTFNVCLLAANNFGCVDTTCQDVQAIINPLVDVPSAFTPGRFGINSQIKVQGFGITKMRWTIYNRWGQKVYESENTKSGWDGTFKGKLQPVDVYAYTLEATFIDGKKVRKTGDITLLR